jgi:hypothetical protein
VKKEKKKSKAPPDAKIEGAFWTQPPPDGQQRFLGVLLRKDTWPMYGFYKEALQGIQRAAFSRGYGLFIVNPAPPGRVENKDAAFFADPPKKFPPWCCTGAFRGSAASRWTTRGARSPPSNT